MTFTGRSLFSLVITVLMAFMIIASLQYDFQAALFPFSVGLVIFFMSLLQFLYDTFPRIRNKLKFIHAEGIDLVKKEKNDSSEKTKDNETPWSSIFVIVVCLMAFAALLSFIPFFVDMFIFLMFFIWRIAKQKPLTALYISSGTIAVLFILFKVILKVQFY